MYLIKRGSKPGKRWVAHIWHGDYPQSLEGDTACRMWSTGGIRRKAGYLVSPAPIHISPHAEKTDLPICSMCAINEVKRGDI